MTGGHCGVTNFVSELWREHGLKPHIQGMFKLSRDPQFAEKAEKAEKVAEIVGFVPGPARGCCRAVDGREKPGPGTGADPAVGAAPSVT